MRIFSSRRPLAASFKPVVPLVLLVCAAPAWAQYNAVSDFSAKNNPNGVWSYGQSSTLGGTFSLFTTSFSGTIAGWQGAGGFPIVYKNQTGATLVSSTVTIPTDVLVMHPSSNGLFSIVRFVAQTAGSYTIGGRFQALDSTTTDVHVLVNGVSLFNGTITQPNTNPDPTTSARSPFNLTQSLGAGDTVDFAVGYGSNKNYFNDSTGLSATITNTTAAPESSSAALLAAGGLCGLVVVSRRKRTR